jgi:hypothetical protein
VFVMCHIANCLYLPDGFETSTGKRFFTGGSISDDIHWIIWISVTESPSFFCATD